MHTYQCPACGHKQTVCSGSASIGHYCPKNKDKRTGREKWTEYQLSEQNPATIKKPNSPQEAPMSNTDDTKTKDKPSASPTDVRVWARDNGFVTGSRGRFSAELVAAYNKAHPRKKYVTPAQAAAKS